MIDLRDVKKQILAGGSIEGVLSKLDWQGFESAVAEIFVANDFSVWKNLRFKTNRRHEIDIVASKIVSGRPIVFCVDCKEWGRGRYKNSALRKAAEAQIARTEELESFTLNNPIARNKLKIEENSKFYPTIVTLFEESGTDFDNVFMVPVWKLNMFLNSFFQF